MRRCWAKGTSKSCLILHAPDGVRSASVSREIIDLNVSSIMSPTVSPYRPDVVATSQALRDPGMGMKIQKLIAAGVLGTK
jgi:hypothetical protein